MGLPLGLLAVRDRGQGSGSALYDRLRAPLPFKARALLKIDSLRADDLTTLMPQHCPERPLKRSLSDMLHEIIA